jgi:hypothetical protein
MSQQDWLINRGKNMKIRHIAVAAIVIACLVSGCASVNKAGRDASTQAKTFSPITDKAVVYIYRDEILGSAIKLPVTVDGVVVGETGPKSFLELALPPGQHTITTMGEKGSSLSLDAQAGQTYYFWQEVKMGMWAARSMLHKVDTEKGQNGVRECELLQTAAPAFRMPDGGVVKPVAPPTSDRAAEASPTQSAASASAQETTGAAPASLSTATATAAASTEGTLPATGGPASLDPRVSVPMFNAAQNLAAAHQCDRMIRVHSIDGNNARLFSTCPSGGASLEIVCNGADCHEGAPQG